MAKKFEDMPDNVQQTILDVIRGEFARGNIGKQSDADAVVTIVSKAFSKLYEDDACNNVVNVTNLTLSVGDEKAIEYLNKSNVTFSIMKSTVKE
jgi:hypothetical protein